MGYSLFSLDDAPDQPSLTVNSLADITVAAIQHISGPIAIGVMTGKRRKPWYPQEIAWGLEELGGSSFASVEVVDGQLTVAAFDQIPLDTEGFLSAAALMDFREKVARSHPMITSVQRYGPASSGESAHDLLYDVRTDATDLPSAIVRATAIRDEVRAGADAISGLAISACDEAVIRWNPARTADLMRLYKRIDDLHENGADVASKLAKGPALEELLSRLAREVDGFSVEPNVVNSSEEIDILILNESPSVFFQKMSTLLLIECKNQVDKACKNDYVILRDKMENRNDKCDLGILVSWSGFTRKLRVHRARRSTEPKVVVLLDKGHIWNAINMGLGGLAEIVRHEWLNATRS